MYSGTTEDRTLRISQRSIEEVRETAEHRRGRLRVHGPQTPGRPLRRPLPLPRPPGENPLLQRLPRPRLLLLFRCLEANERIWTSKGLIPIAEAEPGDEVIGLGGRRETIIDKWFKSGPTLRIKTGAANEGIELTPDHHCVFVKREEALRAIPRVHQRQAGGKKLRFSSRHRREERARPTIRRSRL